MKFIQYLLENSQNSKNNIEDFPRLVTQANVYLYNLIKKSGLPLQKADITQDEIDTLADSYYTDDQGSVGDPSLPSFELPKHDSIDPPSMLNGPGNLASKVFEIRKEEFETDEHYKKYPPQLNDFEDKYDNSNGAEVGVYKDSPTDDYDY